MRWWLGIMLLMLAGGTAMATEPFQNPVNVLPAEIIELEGAVNLLHAPNHEVNAALGDRLGDGEVLLVGPEARAMIRLKDGTRITATRGARLVIRPLGDDRAMEAAELIMLKGRFLIRRPFTHGRLPEYRLVSACGAVRDGGYSWRVSNLGQECVYDGLNVADPQRTPVVAVFEGYRLNPWAGRDRPLVFERASNWHTGP